jgi:uncharacterized protein
MQEILQPFASTLTEVARSILLSSNPDTASLHHEFQTSFGLSPSESARVVYELVLQINSRLFPPVTQLELVHTEGCNLACHYCFEKNMLGYRKMPAEVTRAAIDLLFDYSGNESNLQVTHFGGEPTLNYSGIQHATEYALARAEQERKSVRFDMTTNGVLLNEAMVEYFAQNQIMVLLSVDGLQASHDLYRVDKRGRGTYARVMKGLTILKTVQPWIGVKMTVMPQNAGSLFEDAVGLYELGVNEFIIGHATGVPWSETDVLNFGTQLRKLFVWYKNANSPDIRIREFDEAEVDDEPHFGCQAGRNSIAVTVDGQVSPCSKIMGFDSKNVVCKLGDVWNGLTHIRNRSELNSCGSLKKACAERGIAKEFRGGCFAVNYGESGELFIPSLQEHTFSIVKRSACSGCVSHRNL